MSQSIINRINYICLFAQETCRDVNVFISTIVLVSF